MRIYFGNILPEENNHPDKFPSSKGLNYVTVLTGIVALKYTGCHMKLVALFFSSIVNLG